MKQDMILILDLGSTENTVLARAIRDLGVYSEIYPYDTTAEQIKSLENVKGIILNGGENREVDGKDIDIQDDLYSLNIPMISINHPLQSVRQDFRSFPARMNFANLSLRLVALRQTGI